MFKKNQRTLVLLTQLRHAVCKNKQKQKTYIQTFWSGNNHKKLFNLFSIYLQLAKTNLQAESQPVVEVMAPLLHIAPPPETYCIGYL